MILMWEIVIDVLTSLCVTPKKMDLENWYKFDVTKNCDGSSMVAMVTHQ